MRYVHIGQGGRTIDRTTCPSFNTMLKTVVPRVTDLIDTIGGTKINFVGIETDIATQIHRGIQINFNIGACSGTTIDGDINRVGTGKKEGLVISLHLYPARTHLVTDVVTAPVRHFHAGRLFGTAVFGVGVGDRGTTTNITTATSSGEALVLINTVGKQNNITGTGSGADWILTKQHPS